MRVLIDGKPVDTLTAKQERALRLSRVEAAVQGSVLGASDATNAYITQTRRLHIILGSIGIVLILGISVAGAVSDPIDGWLMVPAGIVIAGALALLLHLMLRHRIRAWNRALGHHGEGMAPAGTAIGVDAQGLSLAGEVFAWRSLAIDQVEITSYSAGGDSPDTFHVIDRLSLAAATRIIVLDKAMMQNGPLLVDNAWRLLRAPS